MKKLDNFQIEQFSTCPRKFYYRVHKGYTTKHRGAALGFGVTLHEGLREWYTSKNFDLACDAMKAVWQDTVEDDYRTFARAVAVLEEYTRYYDSELLKIVHNDDNHPMLEITFQVDTGRGFIYTGIFDGLMTINGEYFVFEHKTTSQLGAQYFRQYKPNGQVTGYMWAASRIFGKPVVSAMINAIGVLKTQTKLDRHITTRTPEETDEWLDNVCAVHDEIVRCETADEWPQRTVNCIGKYGACEFHDICALSSPENRARLLDQDYVIEPWDPEHRDKITEKV